MKKIGWFFLVVLSPGYATGNSNQNNSAVCLSLLQEVFDILKNVAQKVDQVQETVSSISDQVPDAISTFQGISNQIGVTTKTFEDKTSLSMIAITCSVGTMSIAGTFLLGSWIINTIRSRVLKHEKPAPGTPFAELGTPR